MAINELVRETVVGLLYGIFMWGTRFSSPCISRRSRRPSSPLHGDDEKGYHGLSIALDTPEVENARNDDDDDEKKTRILKSCMAPPAVARRSSPTSFFTLLPSDLSSLWTTSTTGDFLGTESGVHMVSAEPGATAPWGNPNPSPRRTTNRRLKQEVKRWDIPPPLTWLQGRREYSTVPRPYSLNREYINGRLVLKEVAVENFQHLQATGRADTRRLPIHLVVAEDDQENSFPGADDNRIPVS